MIVYIEDCLIENFFVTFLILKSMSNFLKFSTSKIRLVCACLFASVVSTFYPLLYFDGILLIALKLVVGVVIICIAYKQKILSKYIIFMFFTAIFGGLNIAVYYLIYGSIFVNDNFPSYLLIAFLFAVYYLLNMCIKLINKRAVISNFEYAVKIFDGDLIVTTKAFLDSGNTLLDQDSTPILIINYKLFNKLYCDIEISDILAKNYKSLKNPHYVKSKFASGGANILVFDVDEVQIDIAEKQKVLKNAKLGVSYARFNQNFNCDMLLNINIFV